MELKPEMILIMEPEEILDTLNVLVLDFPKIKKEIEKYVYGINIEFDIRNIIKGYYNEKPKSGYVYLKSENIRIPLKCFDDEMDARKALARKTIIDITERDSPLSARE
jgi:hypothetical protein